MNILIVSEVFFPENFIVNDLAEEWKIMGHNVEVLTPYPSYPYSYVYDGYVNKGYTIEDWNGIQIHRFPFVEGYRDSVRKKIANYCSYVKEGIKLAKEISKNFDCIFVSQTGPLTVALPAIAARKKWGIPVAIWTQDIWPDAVYSYGIPNNAVTNYFIDRLIKYIYNHCDEIFISSKRFEETISKYVEKHCVYTPNWLKPTENQESSLRLDKEKFHFTFTGNVSRFQNLINTVRGFAAAKLDDCILNIVGDGSFLNQVKDVVDEENIENVEFHGRFPYNEMNDILCQSNALVLPLIPDEGIMKTEPFKIQSYLNAGKPILGILGGSGQDIIEGHKLGICTNPNDVQDIARGFREMVAFSNLHGEEVRVAAGCLMNSRFNKSIIVSTFTERLIELSSKRPPMTSCRKF